MAITAHQDVQGFTLVEVIFAILLLGMMAMGITHVYYSSLTAMHAEENLVPLDSRLRGRMEEIISRSFPAITDGSETVTINGESHTITWTVSHPDLDGDGTTEPLAKTVTVTTGNRTLTTIVIDSQGVIGKI